MSILPFATAASIPQDETPRPLVNKVPTSFDSSINSASFIFAQTIAQDEEPRFGKSVLFSDIPIQVFEDYDGNTLPSPLVDKVVRNPAELFQVLSNLGYQNQNGGKAEAINMLDVVIQSGDKMVAEKAKLITLAGTELFERDQGNDISNYISGLLNRETTYHRALDQILETLPEGTKVILAGHSAGAISLTSARGEDLLERAEKDYGVEIEHVASFGAPYVGDATNISGLNDRRFGKLESTQTLFSRYANNFDPVSKVSLTFSSAKDFPDNVNLSLNVPTNLLGIGAIAPNEDRPYNALAAHGSAYADSSINGYGNRDVFGVKLQANDSETPAVLDILGDSLITYPISKEQINSSVDSSTSGAMEQNDIQAIDYLNSFEFFTPEHANQFRPHLSVNGEGELTVNRALLKGPAKISLQLFAQNKQLDLASIEELLGKINSSGLANIPEEFSAADVAKLVVVLNNPDNPAAPHDLQHAAINYGTTEAEEAFGDVTASIAIPEAIKSQYAQGLASADKRAETLQTISDSLQSHWDNFRNNAPENNAFHATFATNSAFKTKAIVANANKHAASLNADQVMAHHDSKGQLHHLSHEQREQYRSLLTEEINSGEFLKTRAFNDLQRADYEDLPASSQFLVDTAYERSRAVGFETFKDAYLAGVSVGVVLDTMEPEAQSLNTYVLFGRPSSKPGFVSQFNTVFEELKREITNL